MCTGVWECVRVCESVCVCAINYNACVRASSTSAHWLIEQQQRWEQPANRKMQNRNALCVQACLCVCVHVSACSTYAWAKCQCSNNNKSNCTQIFVNAPLSNDYDKFNWILYKDRRKQAYTCMCTHRQRIKRQTEHFNICIRLDKWINGQRDGKTVRQTDRQTGRRRDRMIVGLLENHAHSTPPLDDKLARFRCRLSCSNMRWDTRSRERSLQTTTR